MAKAGYVPEAGDLVWTGFDARLGREQGLSHPALVVSPAPLFRASAFAIVCPIAEKGRRFGANVALPPGLPVAGEVLTAHVRSLDTRARPFRYAGAAVPLAVLAEVRAKLAALCGMGGA
ncbi:type II toxin-antitoxin system PemK/MazF family toxin [Methylocapsa sp. S129]|uniref:type II toxin-antitoxin system PemK/MazF family toxin n=1 Tax=Methylocapsa sp. S129 TaxID=1641869 RepID=UPI00131B258D|nr:type II toxin-antitoxin system PemK/MazF family toxin [Methylocapsa sp. S129]